MQSWPAPHVPSVAGTPVPLALFDTADHLVKPVDTAAERVGMYVCGITPYDSTHLGHAATYLTFDVVQRQLIANGHDVHYVQNITDVDDPLFERAQRDGVDWRDLGASQVDLFRSDMEILSVIPPEDYIGAIEAVDEVVEMVASLLDRGAAYRLEQDGVADIYAPITATEQFGYESNLDRATMERYFAERGGDPERKGKRDPLDALLWRGHREGEPAWESPFGPGRPGWHVECSAIATNRLGAQFSIQGGGSDLAFPHHEFSAAHAEAAYGINRMANHYVHAGMISLDGVKMSKSLGNLVFVHKLSESGYSPSAIRLAIFAGHYREDRDFSYAALDAAEERLAGWRSALAGEVSQGVARTTVDKLRAALADDLDTPTALAVIDAATGDYDGMIATALDGLLGVRV